jgi:hypothetical protein
MVEKSWKTYEEVAAYLLDQFASYFGVDRFEGKQSMPGSSGTDWEIDAKGCSDDGTTFLVVECKRHTKQGVSQAIAGSLAFTIQDVGAAGGILVTPLGLQAGAMKVAASSNVVEVVLDKDSTTTDYVLRFLNQLCIGFSERVTLTDSLSITVIDKDGNVVDRREA